MDGEVFISRHSWHSSFMDNMIKVLFPICTLNYRVNNYFYRHGKSVNRIGELKALLTLHKLVAYCYCTHLRNH